jgi:hypothetical protein
MTEDLSLMLVRELETFVREVELHPDDESLWKTLPGVTNSAGNLALHACGNLKHFVARGGRRAEVAAELRETARIVAATLAALPESALADPYPEPVANLELPCGRFLMHLATHLAFHLGQASYLRRVVTGEAQGSGALALSALAGR